MQIMSPSAVALQLLQSLPPAGQLGGGHSGAPFQDPPSRFVPSLPELTGIYSDPSLVNEKHAQQGMAQRTISAIQQTVDNEYQAYADKAKAHLESALGRPLEEGERYATLDLEERMEVPEEVAQMNRSAEVAATALHMAMSLTDRWDLDTTISTEVPKHGSAPERPEALQGLDMSKSEDRQAAVDFAINSMAGIQLAGSDEVAAQMMAGSLHKAGAVDMDALRNSYQDLHRARFESGELTVVFDGVEITRDDL